MGGEFRTYMEWCKDNGKEWRLDDDCFSVPLGNALYEATAIAWARQLLIKAGLNF
ncbi:hypothetical protein H6G33_04145 [Calothrix sp. FACHB-1219]|uniref:hypothetical protein n=1 Tax=unclassified Calothrix TaxID=2619626 RepID=UPI0016896BD1|nr:MULTISPECIES: hypothetical protein [unclassified Calothrix]MBD2204957.1 hypothetical protein [Calothrix sp. FACHB-168]MBD2216219.1 hypothetical protein [Calothrix sp. FACHB-1219]